MLWLCSCLAESQGTGLLYEAFHTEQHVLLPGRLVCQLLTRPSHRPQSCSSNSHVSKVRLGTAGRCQLGSPFVLPPPPPPLPCRVAVCPASQLAQCWHSGSRGSCVHLRSQGLAAFGLLFIIYLVIYLFSPVKMLRLW